jgi:hypothetical protein
MKRTTTFSGTLTLAVVLCLAFASMAQAGPAKRDPIWSIFKDGTTEKVDWEKADNPRFLIHANDTPGDETDDVVLDQETGLVWMKIPGTTLTTWFNATYGCINVDDGDRMGWRLPTIEELQSLWDATGDGSGLSLPSGHPFSLIDDPGTQPSYWTSTTDILDPAAAYPVCFAAGCVYEALKVNPYNYMWCVRGGYGYDAH